MNKNDKKELLFQRIIDIRECLEVAKANIKIVNNNIEILEKSINFAIEKFENMDDFIDLLDNFDDYKELFNQGK
ncbi:MAG: hypothetical protein ACD_20C00298G0002 [uncultured bacterium]|nr:MAG: hypothetical protein ACD_20C00298G0002 [uncultured bacterium]HBH18656.1 hypothetical protein [Cyanobacteria bacterium UBA9579]